MSAHENDTPPRLGAEVLIDDLDPIRPPSPPPATPTQIPPSSLTPDDLDFIDRAFAQVEHIDFRAPTTPPKGRLTGIDKKLFDLREQVRRLERELARVGFIWSKKQEELSAAEHVLRAKDAEIERALGASRALESKIGQQIEQISSLESQIDEQTGQIKDGNKVRIDQMERLEEVEVASARALSTKENELLRSRNAYDALKELSHGHKETSRDQLISARMQNEELRDRLAAMELQATTRMRDAIAQVAFNSELQIRANTLEETRARLTAELDTLNQTATRNDAGNQATKQQLETEHREVVSELDDHKERVRILENNLADLREQNAKLTDDSTTRVQSLHEELTRLKTELERSQSMAQSQKSALDRIRQDSEKRQDENASKVAAASVELNMALEKQAALEAELEAIKGTQSCEQSAREQSAGLVDSLKARIHELEDKLNSSTSELQQKAQSMAELEHRGQDLIEKLKLAERDRATLAQRLGQLEAT